MIAKRERTKEAYLKAGADLCLCREILQRAILSASGLLYAKQGDKLVNALHIIQAICVSAEDNMVRDFPDLGSGVGDVFFRSFREPAMTDLARRIDELVVEELEDILSNENINGK